MACLAPLIAYRARKFDRQSGTWPISFKMKYGYQDVVVTLPCGKCLGCKADYCRIWAIRCYHEAQLHDVNSFLTLTYDDAHLDGKLHKEHLQIFWKRLRNAGFKFRYYAVGEFGSQTHRPHYHAIVFGQSFRAGSVQVDSQAYSNAFVNELWEHGFCYIAPVNMSTICYVSGYTNKKLAVHDDEYFRPLKSSRPGIGFSWLDKFADDVKRTGHVVIEGRKMAVPAVYLHRDEDKFWNLLVRARQEAASSVPLTDRQQDARLLYLKSKQSHQKRKDKL